MAVQIVANMAKFFAALGAADSKAALDAQGIQVVSTPGALKFMQAKTLLASVPVKAGLMQAITNGAATGPEKAGLKQAVAAATSKALADSAPPPADTDSKTAPPPAPPAPAPPMDAAALAMLLSAARVKLADATCLYQPVFATSAASRYYVVALHPQAKVAARYHGNKLSLRVEGDIDGLKETLTQSGLDVHSHYASLHLSAPDNLKASKAVGAVLMALGLPFQTPYPELKHIFNK
ncbi:hypothetical protein [Niveispirillum sp. BGYR6]|uniref:hypothetical protein n=1 Tax=Niveispirillum sp. BGYR6 TaxID=2971249 RepID=UPI0022B9B8E0|nr:hypothetical protein [Niveispirillum sp. BGYR6]MDG5496958.1 hypothetical protein [Niveispirillum sp. BGYR6]